MPLLLPLLVSSCVEPSLILKSFPSGSYTLLLKPLGLNVGCGCYWLLLAAASASIMMALKVSLELLLVAVSVAEGVWDVVWFRGVSVLNLLEGR